MKNVGRRAFLIGAASLSIISFLKPTKVAGWLVNSNAHSQPEEVYSEPNPAPDLAPPPLDCDYVLHNGVIVDGTGAESFRGNVAIKNDEIVAVGDFETVPEAEGIDASGLIVSPGFIDLHTHTENYLLHNGAAQMILLQGVTSQIGGNCGTSVNSIEDYFAALGSTGVNIGLFAGYKILRQKHLGGGQKPSFKQLQGMQEELAKGLKAGAFGLSVGLSYWPQIAATQEELIELCQVVKAYGGFYSTHIRNEEDTVLPSVEEAIEIGLRAGVPVEYSHIKTAQKKNWGKMSKALEMLEGASQSGLDITGDVYGYSFSSLDLGSERNSISEDDMLMALQHPLIMVGSDSGLNNSGAAIHPRAYGNYPRILSRFVRDQRIIPLEEAIKKMTWMPARRLGLNKRGALAKGMKADISVFDLEQVADRGTRLQPSVLAEGMKYVFVNGKLAVAEGKPTGVLAGQPLKHS